jgi:hypothetical protein
MKKVVLLPMLLPALLLLGGCLEVDTLVRVKSDGSGTVEEKVVMSKVFVEQMKAMAAQMGSMGGSMGGGEEAAGGFDLLDEKKLRSRAAAMGEGVSLVSAEPLVTESGEGYRAVFSFTDINKLKINQNPSDAVPAGPGGQQPSSELIAFTFTPGSPATLTLVMPESEEEGESPTPADEEMPFEEEGGMGEMNEQTKAIFQDLKISMAIEVDGEIVDTNATHREGSRLTLMEMDFGKILEDPEKFQALSSSRSQSLEEAKELMKNIPGIKVELNRELKVSIK